MKPVTVLIAGLLALGAALAAGCSDEEEVAMGPQQVSLVGLSARFKPATATVKAHRPVQVMLKNTDLVEHDWVMEGMPAIEIDDDIRKGHNHDGHDHGTPETGAIAAHAAPGQTGRAWFTPVQPGRYEFYCSVPGHRQSGMTGTLIVE